MSFIVWNILDLLEKYGEENVDILLSGFSTKTIRNGEQTDLNPDIENFLKKNAIQFAKEKKSVTYLVCDRNTGLLLGYFTLTHKSIEIPPDGLSKTKLRTLEKFSRYHEKLNAYTVSAFLIAQFGKNYQVDNGNRITGSDLMQLVDQELFELQHRVGGGLKYLDCEADAHLINFYQKQQNFILYGERISERDGKRYLQFLKFF